MSYNLVNPTTGDLTRVAGNSNIVDSAIKIDSTWSSKKINDSLADKQDFRIFNSLEEFNKKKGTSLTVVSGIDNMKDIANAMSNGEILIIITKYELGSEVYFGLTKDTGWTKMFTFVKSNGLCDVECRTTFPLTFKRVLNSDGVIGDWQELATTDSTLKTIQLSGSVDCNTLTEPGLYTASAGAVSALTNAPVNNQVHLDGGFSILVTKTNADGVYYGMQMFIPYGSDLPFMRKSYYLNGQYWTPWEQLATMDKVNALHEATTGYITESLLGSVVKKANLYYQKFGDSRLVINGWVSIDAVSTRTPIFTLPNDWKVNSNYLLPCYVDNSNVACACVIDIETGTVKSYTPLPATLELRFCGEIYLI